MSATDGSSFSEQLLQFNDTRSRMEQSVNLTIEKTLNQNEYRELAKSVKIQPAAPFHKITLHDPEIDNDGFRELLQALKSIRPDVLELTLTSPLTPGQQQNILVNADFPVLLTDKNTGQRITDPTFEKRMIENIQQRQANIPSIAHSVDNVEEKAGEAREKIKLKALIKSKTEQEKAEFNKYIKHELQHTEVIDIQEEVVLESVVESGIQSYYGNLVDYAEFNNNGKYRVLAKKRLYDSEPIESAFKQVQYELFANLHHAVKYLTPDAAEYLAEHLPQLAGSNLENHPKGFILKKTRNDEYVLDYDEFAEAAHENPFRPQVYKPYDEKSPFYTISLDSRPLKELINNDAIFERLKENHKPLMNLWLFHGDKGIKTLFEKINQLDNTHPGLSVFLDKHYLSHFDHLDCFHNDDFFYTLTKLQHYTPTQINCLKRFMTHTGSSRHNLEATLIAFDRFWQEVTDLCNKNKADINHLDTDWIVPQGCQPAVYMERLLSILKNARDLNEQFKCLNYLKLDNYGPYYASRFEAFKTVSPQMEFNYNPEEQNKKPLNSRLYQTNMDEINQLVREGEKKLTFHPFLIKKKFSDMPPIDFKRSWYGRDVIARINTDQWNEYIKKGVIIDYRIFEGQDFENYEIINDYISSSTEHELTHLGDVFPVPPKTIYALIYRFVGQQTSGMMVSDLNEGFIEYKKDNTWKDYDKHYNTSRKFLNSLMFITHERTTNDARKLAELLPKHEYQTYQKKPIPPTLTSILNNNTGYTFDDATYNSLQNLYQQNIKLNELEGIYYTAICSADKLLDNRERANIYYNLLTTTIIDSGLPPDKLLDTYNDLLARTISICSEKKVMDTHHLQRNFYNLLANSDESRENRLAVENIMREARARDEAGKRLEQQLIKNKYAAFKFIQLTGPLSVSHNKLSSIYALNIADYLSESPDIANTFPDQLLMFSAMIRNYNFNNPYQVFLEVLKAAPDDINTKNLNKIREYLQMACSQKPDTSYLHLVVKLIVDNKQFMTHDTVVKIFDAVNNLSLKEGQMDIQAVYQLFKDNNIQLSTQIEIPDTKISDNANVKQLLIEGINGISQMENIAMTDIKDKSIKDLQLILMEKIAQSNNIMIRTMGTTILKRVLNLTKTSVLEDSFQQNRPGDTQPDVLMSFFAKAVSKLNDLQDCSDFEKLSNITTQIESLANVCKKIKVHACISQDSAAFTSLFSGIHFSSLDSDSLYRWLDLLSCMPQRDYRDIVKAMTSKPALTLQKETFMPLIVMASTLNTNNLQTEAIAGFCQRYISESDSALKQMPLYEDLVKHFIKINEDDNNDPLLTFMLKDPKLTISLMHAVSTATMDIHENRDRLANLFKHIHAKQGLEGFFKVLQNTDKPRHAKLLSILAKAHATRRKSDPDVLEPGVLTQLQNLDNDQLNQLHELYQFSHISMACLDDALGELKNKTFDDFLTSIEKSPFGKRNLKDQFNCDQVERVINESSDMINDSRYPYQYRKQLMEAFLLVNEMGSTLPVFNGKPVKDLSNMEIQSMFRELRANQTIDPLQKRLRVLALMREAMYRSTGQFPFSTQMIALLDCMLHEGDIIQNIDTGQGKSLIDIMKSAMLYLESDCVLMTTSSLTDAKRDIESYSPFWELLGIPFKAKPVTAQSDFKDFSTQGINYSTFSQFSLLWNRAKAFDHPLIPADKSISMVVNESDHALLDDQVIYRFASPEGVALDKKHEWIYTAINDYVRTDQFKANDTEIAQDIRGLKRFLANRAKSLGKSPAIINKFDDARFLNWIESAILVNYKLRLNFDYVIEEIPDKPGHRAVKVLMEDGRVSPDSQLGNGVHQLLHARHQQLADEKSTGEVFTIAPETRTMVSSNNRNLIDFIRSKKGYIWGSSGTAGSSAEVQEQYTKYGFEFSKIEPHHKKIVKTHDPVVLENQDKQFERLVNEIKIKRKNNAATNIPTLIFCEDIETAEKLHQYLLKNQVDKLQLYTGTGNEEHAINNAATPGMITVTTSAIGRNTDIAYNKTTGMDVWHTCVSQTRLDRQKTGRTGRQGSPGNVRYFLDKTRMKKNTLQELREDIDRMSAEKRQFNEELYIIMGSLLNIVESVPSCDFLKDKTSFFKQEWAVFSAKWEAEYRKYRENGSADQYDRAGFVQKSLTELLDLLHEVAPHFQTQSVEDYTRAIANEVYASKDKYSPWMQPVSMNECIPPVNMVWQLQSVQEQPMSDEQVNSIKAALNNLLSDLTRKNVMEKNAAFLSCLNASPVNQKQIRTIYEETLSHFLTEQANKSMPLYKRLLGYQGKLSRIASNPAYFTVFHALTSITGEHTERVKPDVFKHAVSQLLEDYLRNSWFISSTRRKATIQLQENIGKATSNQDIIRLLSQSQLDIADQDIEANKAKWRAFKPVNVRGQSRLQNVISDTLSMAASLGVQTESTGHFNKLVDKLAKTQRTGQLKTPKTVDEVNQIVQSTNTMDKANAATLSKLMKKSLEENKTAGMEGRRPPSGKAPK